MKMILLVGLAASLAFVASASADVVTWGAAQNTSAPGDVSTNGRLVEAINLVGSSLVPGSTTVNGVFFTNDDTLLSEASTDDFLAEDATGDDAYDALIGSLDYGGGPSTSIEVGSGNLIVGARYEIQLWYTDLRGLAANFAMTYGDGNGNTVTLDANTGGFGQFALGTFTADATTQTLTLVTSGFGNGHLNAYQIRALVPVEIIHTEGTNLVHEENETTDSFTIVLTEEPNVPLTVTVDPATDDLFVNDNPEPNDPITLVFGTDDWDTPQTVTVKANDDDEAEGEEVVTISIILASDSPAFTGETDVSVTVVDNDSASVVIEESEGATAVIEGGATDSYTVMLGFAPISDVAITIDDSGDPNQTTVDGGETTTLTFTPSNWDTPQTVTVEATDDDVPETQPHNTALTHTVSQPGGDNAYDGFSVDNVAVSVGENDCGTGPFSNSDLNEDCITNLLDFAIVAGDYLFCSIAVCD